MLEISTQLIKKVEKKERKAQIELYRLCFNDLMSIASRYNKNEEDSALLVNNCFLKIIDNLNKYNSSKPFQAWIRRIAINEVIDDYRKNKKRKELFVDTENIESNEGQSFSEIDHKIEAEELNNMLFELPKATRTVFSLIAIDGYSHKEIAKQLNISLETSKWHMKEARKRLKIMLIQKQQKSDV
ncbi:MAG: RNA polymerase subunit sigma-24 [Flavobacteriales bacterium]|nr:MAG: RNA polymerase subunit sigma-24 [Flavobacteriales bacterium]